MVDQISLLPPEFFERKNRESRNRKLKIIPSTLLCISIIVYGMLWFSTADVQSQIEPLEARLRKVEERMEELKEYQEKKDQLDSKVDILEEAIGYNPNMPEVVKEINRTVPQEVVLDKLEGNYEYDAERDAEGNLKKGRAYISIEGRAYSSAAVLEVWKQEIERVDKVLAVRYHYTPIVDDWNRLAQAFRIDVAVDVSTPYRVPQQILKGDDF
jgi:Tfp pilus assembly protein PilN